MKRITAQRRAIESVITKNDRPLTIEEILNYGRETVPSLNIATVYRTLKILLHNGWLEKISHPQVGTFYERSGKDHHHHFYCRKCNRAYELPGCALNADKAAPEGFMVEDHEVFLIGKCPTCV